MKKRSSWSDGLLFNNFLLIKVRASCRSLSSTISIGVIPRSANWPAAAPEDGASIVPSTLLPLRLRPLKANVVILASSSIPFLQRITSIQTPSAYKSICTGKRHQGEFHVGPGAFCKFICVICAQRFRQRVIDFKEFIDTNTAAVTAFITMRAPFAMFKLQIIHFVTQHGL